MIKVADVMSRSIRIVAEDRNLVETAKLMKQEGVGVLPVGEQGRVRGVVTDRDMVLRGLAEGKPPSETPVAEVMTPTIAFIYQDQTLEDAVEFMGREQIRRLAVVNRDEQLVGMLSLGDVARKSSERQSGDLLKQVSAKTHRAPKRITGDTETAIPSPG